MIDEYAETKQFVEEEKPYWLFLDAERGTELSFNLFNYFPEAHYKQAIDQALELEAEERLRTDGGRCTDTLFAWYDPDTDTYLTQVEAGEEFASPFFEEEDEARRFLEHRVHEVGDESRYEGLSLQKLKAKKVGEAVEVLTDQSGIEDFMPDGGFPETVYLWYDPATDRRVDGLFHDKEAAVEYMADRSSHPSLDDVSRFELYEADLDNLGNARKFIK